jgi:hypothetical protein
MRAFSVFFEDLLRKISATKRAEKNIKTDSGQRTKIKQES